MIHKEEMYNPLSEKEEFLGKEIVDAAFKVHKELGPGLLERVYEACFCYEPDLLIQLPAFNPLRDVTAPKGTSGFQLQFTAAVLSFNDPAQNKCLSPDWSVSYEDKIMPYHQMTLPGLTTTQALVLIVMGMRYYRGNKTPIDQMWWKPVEIVGSFYN